MTDVIDISKMPEWAKQMACDKASARNGNLVYFVHDVDRFPILTELALMCWRYCDEPVDPDLLIAREAVAQVCERIKLDDDAARFRNGKMDHSLRGGATHIAARLAREQGAK